jgi:hypothetical protein
MGFFASIFAYLAAVTGISFALFALRINCHPAGPMLARQRIATFARRTAAILPGNSCRCDPEPAGRSGDCVRIAGLHRGNRFTRDARRTRAVAGVLMQWPAGLMERGVE